MALRRVRNSMHTIPRSITTFPPIQLSIMHTVCPRTLLHNPCTIRHRPCPIHVRLRYSMGALCPDMDISIQARIRHIRQGLCRPPLSCRRSILSIRCRSSNRFGVRHLWTLATARALPRRFRDRDRRNCLLRHVNLVRCHIKHCRCTNRFQTLPVSTSQRIYLRHKHHRFPPGRGILLHRHLNNHQLSGWLLAASAANMAVVNTDQLVATQRRPRRRARLPSGAPRRTCRPNLLRSIRQILPSHSRKPTIFGSLVRASRRAMGMIVALHCHTFKMASTMPVSGPNCKMHLIINIRLLELGLYHSYVRLARTFVMNVFLIEEHTAVRAVLC